MLAVKTTTTTTTRTTFKLIDRDARGKKEDEDVLEFVPFLRNFCHFKEVTGPILHTLMFRTTLSMITSCSYSAL